MNGMKGFFAAAVISVLVLFCSCSTVSADELTIVLLSDINDSYGSTSYSQPLHESLRYILDFQPDLVICGGDMVAGQNIKLDETQLRAMWQAFDATVLRPINQAGIPFAFTLGNHDGPATPKYAHERLITREFWLSRRPGLKFVDYQRFPENYSFVMKNVFFAVLDAAYSDVGNEQRSWLQAQLAGKAARSARLRVVLGHLPLYAVAEGRNNPGDVIKDAESLYEILEQNSVDYYINGHHHAFYVSKKGNLKMLSLGALGGGPRKILGSEKPPFRAQTTLYLPKKAKDFFIITQNLAENRRLVRPEELPPAIDGCNGRLIRYDYPKVK